MKNKEQADEILKRLEGAEFVIDKVKKSVHRKSPAAPFTTSTLQQEASRRLSFQARRTMKTAQELYEGVEINDMGQTGLITYMRTDSLRISDEARAAAYDFIRKNMAISISLIHRKNIKLRATLRTLTKPSDQHTQR